MTAVMARLGRRKEAVALDECFAAALRLVGRKPHECGPRAIPNGLRQRVISHHAFDVQVLEADNLALIDQLTGLLVQEISPRPAHPFMRPGNLQTSFVAVVRSLLFARKFLLFSLQVLLCALQMARVRDLPTIARDGEMRGADINANSSTVYRNRWQRHSIIGQDRSPIAPGAVERNGDGLDFSYDLAMDLGADVSYFRHIDRAPTVFALLNDPETLRVGVALRSMLRTKTWILRAAFEEILIGGGKVLKRALKRLTIGTTQPFMLLFELWEIVLKVSIGQPLAGLKIGLARQIKPPIEHPSRAAELVSQRFSLFGSWVEAYFRRAKHKVRFSAALSKCQERACIPHLKEGELGARFL